MYASVRTSKNSEYNENFTRQGSLRKVLPPEHNNQNLFNRHNDEINNLNKIYRQEYVILAEYKMIQSESIPGVYVIPSRENSLLWFGLGFGVIFVRSGLYEDGIFRFTIILDEKFPDGEHPKVIFQSEIMHPMIDPETKELNLLDAFPTWTKGQQHVWQVLKYIQWIFYRVDATIAKAVNTVAADLYTNDKESFKDQAKALVKLSQDHLYDDPPTEDKHYITFEEYDAETHDKVKASMLNYQEGDKTARGHSWVLPGSFKPMSREDSPQSESES